MILKRANLRISYPTPGVVWDTVHELWKCNNHNLQHRSGKCRRRIKREITLISLRDWHRLKVCYLVSHTVRPRGKKNNLLMKKKYTFVSWKAHATPLDPFSSTSTHDLVIAVLYMLGLRGEKNWIQFWYQRAYISHSYTDYKILQDQGSSTTLWSTCCRFSKTDNELKLPFNQSKGLTTTLEWFAMRRLNCPPVSATSIFFTPGGGRSSKDWMSRPSTIDSNGMAMIIPGQERLPAPNGKNRKSLPEASIFPSKNLSGMNFSGLSQCLGLFPIHHAFTRILLSAGMS